MTLFRIKNILLMSTNVFFIYIIMTSNKNYLPIEFSLDLLCEIQLAITTMTVSNENNFSI